MSTLDYCNATTQTGKLCKRKAVCDSSKHGSAGESYCKQHFTNYYDPSKGKFVVQKVARVAHDKDTGLPMRYVQGLNKKEKQLYKKEIEETNAYYKKTGLVKPRNDVRVMLGRKPSRNIKSQYAKSKSLPKKRSSYSVEFEKRYGFKVTDTAKFKKLFPDTDYKKIIQKGEAAYASGSRPSVTGKGGAIQWGLARLSSSMIGGKAMVIDKNLIGPLSLKVIFSKKYNK
jgi:hypothetical protein